MEIVLELGEGQSIRFPKEGGVTSVGLKENCPYCGQPDCYADCDGSAGDIDGLESEEQMYARKVVNTAIDAVESLLLSFANAGLIRLTDTRLKDAVQTTLDAIANNCGEE